MKGFAGFDCFPSKATWLEIVVLFPDIVVETTRRRNFYQDCVSLRSSPLEG